MKAVLSVIQYVFVLEKYQQKAESHDTQDLLLECQVGVLVKFIVSYHLPLQIPPRWEQDVVEGDNRVELQIKCLFLSVLKTILIHYHRLPRNLYLLSNKPLEAKTNIERQ